MRYRRCCPGTKPSLAAQEKARHTETRMLCQRLSTKTLRFTSACVLTQVFPSVKNPFACEVPIGAAGADEVAATCAYAWGSRDRAAATTVLRFRSLMLKREGMWEGGET